MRQGREKALGLVALGLADTALASLPVRGASAILLLVRVILSRLLAGILTRLV